MSKGLIPDGKNDHNLNMVALIQENTNSAKHMSYKQTFPSSEVFFTTLLLITSLRTLPSQSDV